MIYVDNAATTRMDDNVFEVMRPFFTDFYGNPSQPYSFSRTEKNAIKEAREKIAGCINASPEEILFTSGGTESDNWVIRSVLDGSRRSVLTSEFEHHAILNPCKYIEKKGVAVKRIAPTHEGFITEDNLNASIDNSVGLVSVMFVNNEIGTIQPIKALCEIAHEHGALFHTDAVQAVGHIAIDVKELGIDMLSASAHKFNGPKGVGFLYLRGGLYIPALIDGGGQEYGKRAGTENTPGIVGMSIALENNNKILEENQRKIKHLETIIEDGLKEHQISYIRNGGNQKAPGIMSLSFPGFSGEVLFHRMDLKGIAISTGSACTGQSTETSHVLKAIGLDEEVSRGTIRISLGKNNTEAEAKEIVKTLCGILMGCE